MFKDRQKELHWCNKSIRISKKNALSQREAFANKILDGNCMARKFISGFYIERSIFIECAESAGIK